MKRILTLMLILLLAGSARGQRVGVVFSGGGAKGLYHVGILKALEENNIPVDYVSGASMGAIVAGMYAAGYSPDEMIRFFITDTVQRWLSAKTSDLDNNYYFKKFEPTPTMLTVKIDPKAVRSTAIQIPTNIISPYLLDLAFMRMLSPASAAAGNDFDSLMVPFRCNAADVYHKETVVFDSGSLPFAIRASMTIPLVFKPLTQDTVVLFDGGLYNNYPWQPLDTTFHPDILIGGICASNYENPSADNLVQQISVMATSKTDYSLPDSIDVEIKRRFKEVGVLDYDKASYIIARGYEDAMRQMPLIKERIARRVSDGEIEAKRAAFKASIRPLVFEQIDIEGLRPRQTQYVYRQLGLKPRQLFDAEYFDRKYKQVLAGGVFNGEFPEVTYNPETGFFRLKLKLHTQASMRFSLGGNISSTSLNQGFAGLSYQKVGRNVSTYAVQGYFGTFYNSVKVGGRHDIYTQFPFYIDYNYTYDHYDYTANHMNRYYRGKDWRYRTRNENTLSSSIGIPVLENAAFRGRLTLGVTDDYYFRGQYTNVDKPDRSCFTYANVTAEVQKQSLNYPLYPNRGTEHILQVRFTEGLESYYPGTLAGASPTFKTRNRNWFEVRYRYEQYIPLSKWFTFGFLGEATMSNHPDFDNPLVTSMSLPAFQPIPLMRTMFMTEFRSRSYVGAGVIPVFNIANNFYLKSYAYAFVPQEVAYDHGWTGDIWNRLRKRTEFVFGGSLVYQTFIGPASLTLNKFSTGKSDWQLVFNFGYTLFSSRRF